MQEVVWLSPTEYVTGDRSLTIEYPSDRHPGTIVMSNTTGEFKWISLSLRLPEDTVIEEIIICYQVSNARSFISQIRLSEMAMPRQAIVRFDDPADLKSTAPARYSSIVGGIVAAPGTAMTLEVGLNFHNSADRIYLGAAGVRVRLPGMLRAPCWVTPEDYGAVGDGVTDDASAIQSAINAAQAARLPVKFSAKNYIVGSELYAPAHAVLEGIPYINGIGTTLTAKPSSGIRSVMRCDAPLTLRNLSVSGNRTASYCLWFGGCSLSKFESIGCSGALIDGWHFSALSNGGGHAINDTNIFRDCSAGGNGVLYITNALLVDEEGVYGWTVVTGIRQVVAGTCTLTSGSNSVIFVGAPDLTTLGLRVGDPIRVGTGANKRFGYITAIADAAHLLVNFDTANAGCDVDASNQDFAIGRGDGYHEERSGDNNINGFEGTQLYRGNAGYGMVFDGLYGPRVAGTLQMDFSPFWHIRVGTTGGSPVISSYFHGCYFEVMGAGKPWLLLTPQNMTVISPLDLGGGMAANVSYCGGSATGIYISSGGIESFTANGEPTTVNNMPSTHCGSAWGGGTWRGPFSVWAGNAIVTANVLRRDGNSEAGSLFCGIYSNADETITSIQDGGSLLVVRMSAGGTATFVAGASLILRAPKRRISATGGELIIFAQFSAGVWIEVGFSGTNTADTTGTVGDAIANVTQGRSKFASGTTSCTITNSHVTPDSIVIPVWDANPMALWWVTVVDGSFTLHLAAPAAGDILFRWAVQS